MGAGPGCSPLLLHSLFSASHAPAPTAAVRTLTPALGNLAAGSPCFLHVPEPFHVLLLILHYNRRVFSSLGLAQQGWGARRN